MDRIIYLFLFDSPGVFNRHTRGAMKTGDSKHTAISFKNLLEERKYKLGKSKA
jgi:hypothetical protein